MEAMKCPACGSPDLLQLNEKEYSCKNCDTKSRISENNNYLVMIGNNCPECGFRNEPGDRFCGNCGQKLVKYCVNCGAEVLFDRKFCSNCGNADFSYQEFQDIIFNPGYIQHKIEAIKLVREFTGLGLAEAKHLVENGGLLASNLQPEQASLLKQKFESLGALIEVVPSKTRN
jgi:hypothetical protein